MLIKITEEQSSVAGFISWKRLVEEYLQCELKADEQITLLNVGESGINYFVSRKDAQS
jgi:hypothetical protein